MKNPSPAPFAFLAVIAACACADIYPTKTRPEIAAEQPATLEQAVTDLRNMIDAKRPPDEIARRAGEIADCQITNVNDRERMSIAMNWLALVTTSDEDKRFADWRDNQSGAEAQYHVVAKWVWSNRYGECAENSALVYYLLRSAGAEKVRLMKTDSHRFCVWGMDDEADPNRPESWTSLVLVPDSWSHRVTNGSSAWDDAYLSGSGQNNIDDVTDVYDTAASQRCGSRGKPCCKNAPLPCRGSADLVCNDRTGLCSPCGQSDAQPCCSDGTCGKGLECISGWCRKEGSQPAVLEVWFPASDTFTYSFGSVLVQARISNAPKRFGTSCKAKIALTIDGIVIAADSIGFVDFSLNWPVCTLSAGNHNAVLSVDFGSGEIVSDSFTVKVPSPRIIVWTEKSGSWTLKFTFPGGQVDTMVEVQDSEAYGTGSVVELRMPRMPVNSNSWPVSSISAIIEVSANASGELELDKVYWYSLPDRRDPTTRNLLLQDPDRLQVSLGTGYYLLNIYPVTGPYSQMILRAVGTKQ